MPSSILTVASDSQTEGTGASNRSLVFIVSLSAPATETVRFNWLATPAGTASEIDTYYGTEGNALSIAVGQSSATISILLRADAVTEPDKPWLLTIFNLSGATLADGAQRLTHLGVMQDDDGAGEKRALLVSPGEIVEGPAGTRQMAFSVKLSRAAATELSFDVQTIDGSALAGSDYTALAQTLSFSAGQTEAVVLVPVQGDSVPEGEEFFTLRVTPQPAALASLAPVGAGGGSQAALGRIVDDDTSSTLPEVSVRSSLQMEDTGSSGSAYIYYQVVLSEPATSEVRLSWYHHGTGIARGSAIDDDLHNGEQSNVITIPAGQTTYFLPLRLTYDTVDEIDESLMLEVYGLSGAVFAGGADRLRVLGVILDDDGTTENRSLFVSNPELHEGSAGTRQAVFTVTLSRPATSTLVFDYRTVDGTAIAASDYDAVTGTLTFAPGQTHASVAVTVNGDTLPESAERFALVVTPQAASAAAVANGAETRIGMATLIDSDASATLPELQVVSVAQREGNSGDYPYLNFQLMLSEAPTSRVTVGYYIRQGSADFVDTYSGGSGTVTFEPGATTAYASIRLNGDTTAENDESLVLELFNPVGAVFAGGEQRLRMVGFVLDEDGTAEKRTLFVSSPEVVEGALGTRQAVFVVQLSRPAPTDLVFDYRTIDGTALAGSDYTARIGTLNFIAGQTEATVAVDVLGDTRSETAERFTLLVTPQTSSAAAIAGGANDRAGIAVIVDDDSSTSVPEIHVVALKQREGNSGDYPYLDFQVALSEASTSRVTVGYYIRQGSADFVDTYSGGSGTATFEPGATTAYASIRLNGDTTAENDESLVLELFNPVGAVFAGGEQRLRMVGFVLDEDGTAEKRTLFVSSPEVVEGASGTRQAVFVVQLSRPANTELVFDYRTIDGTAVAGSDYTALTGTVTFLAGQTEAAIAVDVLGDARSEAAERFTLLVTPQSGSAASISGGANDRAGVATIVDDDSSTSRPELHVLALTQREGNSGDYPYLEFQLALSEAPTSRVTVRYDIFQRTANWTDVYSGGSGSAVFEAGQTTAFVSIRMTGDTLIEPDEALVLELYNPVGLVLAGGVDRLRTTGFILDEEGGGEKRALIVADAELLEGAAGTQQMVFRVQLSRPANSELVFDYRTIDGSAVAGSDYTATSGSVTFAPGQTEAAVFVPVSGDVRAETAETFTLLLTPQAGTVAAIGNGVDGRAGLGTIIDDDSSATLPEVSVVAFSIREGNSGDYPYLLFQLALSAAPTSRVSVPYFIRQETAFWPDLYSGGGGTVNFEAGETIAYASVRLTGDTNVEPDEALVLELFNPSGAVFAGGVPRLRMSGFILDDDGFTEKRALMVSDVELLEGASGTTQAAFRVQLSRPASTELVFTYRTVDGTARAGSDYDAASGTLSFTPGQTEATVFVTVSGDMFSEDAETFTLLVTPQAESAAAIGNGVEGRAGVATVMDDDTGATLPELLVQALAQREGNSGDYPYLDVQLMLSEAPTSRVTLQFFAAHGTTSTVATVNLSDTYSGGSGTVTFEPGQTTAWAQIRLQGDNQVEADENYVFEFYNISGAVMAGGAQRLHVPAFILDDDGSAEKRALLVRSVELREGGTGSRDAVFVVQLSRPATTELLFDYRTIDGSAIAGSDYTAASGVLTFAPGQTEATVHVSVRGDFDAEAEEMFSLLVTPQADSTAAIGNGLLGMQGLAWIADDDISTTLPIASLRPARADEHTSTGLNFAFQVSLNEPTVLPARFDYRVVNGTTTGADFSGVTSGSVTVASGASSQWVFITINTDTLPETDESFAVELFNPLGAVLAGGVDRLRASGIIVDDDGAGAKLALVVSEARVLEGNENNSTASFTLQLSRPSTTPITFTYQTADGTAQAGVDYVATSGSVTFLPGQTFAAVNVPVLADLDIELDETFRLLLGANPAVTNGSAAIEVLGTIRSDDPQNPPIGANDRYTAYAGLSLQTSANNGVLANDTDLEQHALTAQLMSPPTRGTLSLAADGSFTYTPQANFVGRDSFTYRPLDPFSSGVSATVWIDVRPASEAPGVVQSGAATQVNTFPTGLQYAPSVAALSGGGFVSVWASRGQDGSGDGIYAQLLSSSGAKVGGEFRVNATTAGHQQAPAVAAVGSGFVVVWDSAGQDGSLDGIVARRFTSTGSAASAELAINELTAGAQVAPDISARADGSFIVAWQGPSAAGTGGDALFWQAISAANARVGGSVQASVVGQAQQSAVQVLVLPDGGSLLLWQGDSASGNGFDIYSQRYLANGQPNGSVTLVNTHTPSYQSYPAVASLVGGGHVVVWSSYGQDGAEYGVFGQRFGSNGLALGAEFQANTRGTGSQERPAITALADGGFVVGWTNELGASASVELQRFAASGSKLGGTLALDAGVASLRSLELATGSDGSVLALAESSGATLAEVHAVRLNVPLLGLAGTSAEAVMALAHAVALAPTDVASTQGAATSQAQPLSAEWRAPESRVALQSLAQSESTMRDSIGALINGGFDAYVSYLRDRAFKQAKLVDEADMAKGFKGLGVAIRLGQFAKSYGESGETTAANKLVDVFFDDFNQWAAGTAAGALVGIGLVAAGVALSAPLAVLAMGAAGFAAGYVVSEYGVQSFRAYEQFSKRSGQELADFLRESWITVGTALSDANSAARATLDRAMDRYGPALDSAWTQFQSTAADIADQMAAAAETSLVAAQELWQTLQPRLLTAKDQAVDAVAAAINDISQLARDVGSATARVLGSAIDAAAEAALNPANLEAMKQALADLMAKIAGGASATLRDILNLFGLGERSIDPIVLDLDGDGLELTALAASRTRFDMDADGFAELTAWVGADDALLALDRNNNGTIDDITELMGGADIDGFSELETWDSNADGVIDVADPVYERLRLWRDANGNGQSEAAELQGLAAAGITAIGVRDTAVNYQIAGNLISAVAEFQRSNGSTGTAGDAWFRVDQLDAVVDGGSTFNLPYTLDLDTLYLPQLRGYGEVPHLYVAMSRTPALKLAVQQLVDMDPSDFAAVRGQVAEILYLWAGQAAVNPASRGRYVDARQLETLEAFLGESYRSARGDVNPPTGRAGDFVAQAWEKLLQSTTAKLLVQTGFGGAFEGARYDFARDAPVLATSLNAVVTQAVVQAPQEAQASLGYWKVAGPVLELLRLDANVSEAAYRAMLNTATEARNLGFSSEQLDNALVSPGISGTRLEGTERPELLLGTAADETFNGGQGGDTYLLGAAHWGTDRILEVTSRSDEAAEDVIVMPEGVLPSQVTISRSANGFVLQRRDSDDSLTVETVNLLGADGDFGIEIIRFSNGVTWNVSSMLGSLAVNAGPDVALTEGQALTRRVTITDPVDNGSVGWTWRVNWSDGQVVTGAMTDAIRYFDLIRSFPDNLTAPLEATITVTDDGTDVDLDRFSVSVSNVAPALSASAPATVVAGASYLLQLAASDVAGAADPLTYSIDWNDGSASQIVTAAQLATGGGQVAHVFPSAPGVALNRTVSVTVNDGDGGTATRTVPVQVVASGLTYSGTDGRDRMVARPDDDAYFGGAGDDVIFPGGGADTIDGGLGYDLVSYEGSAPVVANLKLGTAVHAGRTDTLVNIEVLFGSSGNDSLIGADNALADLLKRGETLRGGQGRDTIDGGSGVDTAEFTGPRAGYTVVRNGNTITVTDIDLSNGDEGTDTLLNVERLVFADQMLAFGTRAEEVARVASVLWTPGIIPNPNLFARGFSFYDGGYAFEQMCLVALQFHGEQGLAFAQKLVAGSGSTTRTVADVMGIMATAAGGDAGRAAAVAVMAMDPMVTATLEAKGVISQGVAAALFVPDFGNLFALFPS